MFETRNLNCFSLSLLPILPKYQCLIEKTSQVYQFTNELELLVYLLIIQKNVMVSVFIQDKVLWK